MQIGLFADFVNSIKIVDLINISKNYKQNKLK